MVVAETGQRRKLEAILSADVAGYSRLMQDDDAATVETLTKYRAIFTDFVCRHEGRIVDSPGDNILAEFDSPVEAVQCAVEIQRELARRNLQLAQHRQMQFRIGINLGDILSRDDGTIYGDGVNVAARLESLAEPGGIMVSESVRMQVSSLIDVSIADAGAHEVKNIAEPVHVYRIVLDEMAPPRKGSRPERRRGGLMGAAVAVIVITVSSVVAWQITQRTGQETASDTASGETSPLELPDKPSIAVMPFMNLTGNLEQEIFVDGFTEEVITELLRFRSLFVIARESTFKYKGVSTEVAQVSRELGVQYVLEGNIRKISEGFRISAQLVDATTGAQAWAEVYDRDLEDMFAAQQEVAQQIVVTLGTLHGPLSRAVQETARRKRPADLKAYEYVLLGYDHKHRSGKENNAEARDLAEKAIALDPEYARAYALLAWVYWFEWFYEWNVPSTQAEKLGLEAARKALDLDPWEPEAHWALGAINLFFKREHDKASARMERALELSPNNADVLADYGLVLQTMGRSEEAIKKIKEAMRLNPYYSDYYLENLGMAFYDSGQYEDAMTALSRMSNSTPNATVYLAASYGQLGREPEAQRAVQEILAADSGFSLVHWAEMQPYKYQTNRNHFVDGLRKTGLPE
jgi:adenylate cyclase